MAVLEVLVHAARVNVAKYGSAIGPEGNPLAAMTDRELRTVADNALYSTRLLEETREELGRRATFRDIRRPMPAR